MEQHVPNDNYKKVSISRVVLLGVLGALVGVLLSVLLDRSIHFYILPAAFAIGFGLLGYLWKRTDHPPQSFEGLTIREWIVWTIVSIIFTPVISGTVAYYMYKHHNKYPGKWRNVNIALLIAVIAEGVLYLMF